MSSLLAVIPMVSMQWFAFVWLFFLLN